MKKWKIVLFALLSIIFILHSTPQTSAQNHNLILGDEQINKDTLADSSIQANPILPKILKMLVKPLINYVGRIPLTSYPGHVVEQTGGDYFVQHPSVDFNSGSINTTVIKNTSAYGQDILRPFMTKNQLFAGRIGIEIFYKGTPVSDRSLKSGEIFDYQVPGGYNTLYNDYEIHYSSHYSERWTPRMWYMNVNPPCELCLPTSIELNKQLEEDYFSNMVIKDNHIFMKQSENYNQTKFFSDSDRLTMNELYAEFYDNTTNELTDQVKTILPDSQIKIVDMIKGLNYSKNKGYTTFKFNSSYPDVDYHIIRFNGDLSNEYAEGDSIELIFNVVETAEIEGNIFVDLDYNLQDANIDEYPSINSFVKK